MDALESTVRQVAARNDWSLDVDACLAHVRMRVGDRTISETQTEELCLAFACASGNANALDALVPIVNDAVTRIRWPDTDVADRSAKLWAHVLGKDGRGQVRLATFDARGPIGAWLRVVGGRMAQRDRPRGDTDSADEDSLAAVWAAAAAGTERDLIKDLYVERVTEAFRTATAQLDDGVRVLLRLHYARGVSLENLTNVYGVHRVTLSRRLAAARRQILEGAVAVMRQQTPMTEQECRSLLRTLRSRIELSLGALE